MEVRIIQQNMNSRNENTPEYVAEIMKQLHELKPTILLLSEFCYKDHQETIVKKLEDNGYKIFYPNMYDKVEHKKFYTVCILAIKADNKENKEEIIFIQDRNGREELAENDFRYITGTLKIKGQEKEMDIKMYFTHVPFSKNISRMAYKAEMLFAAYCFFIENSDEYTFLGGDFNSDINGDTSLLPIFKKLYNAASDTDKDKDKPTWENKRLDYALVSKTLKSCNSCNCETKHLKTKSDHRALITTFKLDI
ncbi:MAG: endonuclease/exonuclease/phosphatase family protein [Oscillospiraceae bacterium]|nr:endonuclease/exonuclease/phosphatase family protein [Oscillospiraceae bacterium]